jgi:hypothetical protein
MLKTMDLKSRKCAPITKSKKEKEKKVYAKFADKGFEI